LLRSEIMRKHGRHAPAFILLMLSKKSNHGLGILNDLNDFIEGNKLDTAIIYRVLKKLETEGAIDAHWEDSASGPKKKVYSITEKGRDLLTEFRKDIEASRNRLDKFIKMYDED